MTKRVNVSPALALTEPDGRPARLGDVLAQNQITVIQLVRYFGCLPCQEWCVDLDAHGARLVGSGIGVVAIGGSADYQARWLRDERGVSMPLLMDPGHQLRKAVGAAAPLGARMLDPRGAATYLGSLRRGYRPRAITRDTIRSPGVVILDASGAVRWRHVGRRLGDYPPVEEVLVVAESLR